MAAITALTAQNTRGVRAVHVPPAEFLTAQLDAISDDISIDAVKIGMLGDAAVIAAVRSWLEKVRPAVVVLDPVMVATSGDRLLQESAEAALRALLPLADLITPNLAELAHAAQGTRRGRLGRGAGAGQAAGRRRPAPPSWSRADTSDGGDCPDALVNTGGLLAGTSWWWTASGSPRATATAPGARCPRPWPPCRPGWGTGKRRCGPSSRGCRARSASPVRWTSGTGNGPVHHFHHLQHPQEPRHAAGRRRRVRRERSAQEPRPTSTRSTAWTSSAAWPTAPCRNSEFAYYLAQDAIYLNGYSRVLARAARHRPHRGRAAVLGPVGAAVPRSRVRAAPHLAQHPDACSRPGPRHKSYVDHLLAASVSGSYGVLVAAVLPVLLALRRGRGDAARGIPGRPARPPAHPYAEWLRTYADEDFAAATRQAIGITDAAGLRRRRRRSGRPW